MARARGRVSTPSRHLALAAVIAITVAFVVHAAALRFTQDDAYISLRYARNLVDGHGLVFNPGERVEGYSNFSWTLLLALLLKLGAPPIETSQWLGMLFGAGAVFAAARLAASIERRWGWAAVTTAALVAACPAFALWSTSGLETAFYVFLVTLGLERGFAPDVTDRGRAAAPVLLCLASLTHPDGVLLFALWFACRVAEAPGRRVLVRDAALFAVPLVPYGIWKLAYYGDLLPNTYYAKAGLSAAYLDLGVRYAREFLVAYGAWGIVPALAAAAILLARPRWGVEARLSFVWICYAAYVVGIGGDVLYEHRFWLPTFPIGAVVVARGAVLVGARLAHWRRGAPAWLVPAVATVAIVGIVLSANWRTVRDRRAKEVGFVSKQTRIGNWLRVNMPSDEVIATTTIGAIGYYSELRVLDLLGLTDREIARNPQLIEGLTDTWRETKYNAESVIRRRPDIVVFSTGVRPSSASEKALYLYKSFYESYYTYFYRSDPAQPGNDAFIRIRDDAPPVHFARVDADLQFIERYADAMKSLAPGSDLTQSVRLFGLAAEIGGPSVPWAREFLAVVLWDLNQKDQALPMLREVYADNPYSVYAIERLALDALLRNDLGEARKLYERLRDIDRHYFAGWMGLAEILRLEGDPARAFEYANEGIRCWNTNAPGLLLLGNLALLLNRPVEAEWAFARGLLLAPDSAPLARGLEVARASR